VRILEERVLESDQRRHCIATIARIVAQKAGDRRSILQLGYNLGRLSELTGLGREPFWDRWKTAVDVWNVPELERLAQELQSLVDENQRDPSLARVSSTVPGISSSSHGSFPGG
jgi:hypothetical protein